MAIQKMQDAIRVDPEYYDAHIVLGLLYEIKRDYKKAKAEYGIEL